MKNLFHFFLMPSLGLLLVATLIISCKPNPDGLVEPIVPTPIDTIPNIEEPEEDVDSIIYGVTNKTFFVTSQNYSKVIDSMNNFMLTFYNVQLSPGYAIKVNMSGGQILDNSTFGYPDALTLCKEINGFGNWVNTDGLLSTTVGNGGQFRGETDRFLGFRFKNSEGKYQYGWTRLTCNGAGNTLTISDFAYRTAADSSILAGQIKLSVPCGGVVDPGSDPDTSNVSEIIGSYHSDQSTNCSIYVYKSTDPNFDFGVYLFPFIWPYQSVPGKIINGKLHIPEYKWHGNMPSPGGSDRIFDGKISGSGELVVQDGKTWIIWQIDYDQTGYWTGQYHGEFRTERCE